MDYFDEIIDEIRSGKLKTGPDVERAKMRLCSRHRMASLPTNADILERLSGEERERFEPLLRIKPVRSASGVAVVAVMTSPADCPHGRCAYCPGGTGVGTPQSYTGHEPAALRAGQNEYDPFRQVSARLSQLSAIGHPVDKIDLIIMGGTFTSRPWEYRETFVRRCLDAMNGRESATLEGAQGLNEAAPARCIGLTVETRPDCIGPAQNIETLRLGGTRIEMGVQSLDDAILKRVERGHDVAATERATRLAKDAGFKVGYHMMPGLPGATVESDAAMFMRLFEDESFKPDMLKIYPTLVMPGTKLHAEWESGRYKPYGTGDVVKLLAIVKPKLPPWVRIQRIQRDIPAQLIADGVKKSHVRTLAKEELARQGKKCRCIRCREAGHVLLDGGSIDESQIMENSISYEASGGTEHFLSFDEPESDALVGYLRLRMASPDARREAFGQENAPEERHVALVRELKIFGQMVPIGRAAADEYQHRKYGARLLETAEEIARKSGAGQIVVTSGVGVRDYYRKFGYELINMGMIKY
ncbi:MAG: tRNA uridine(34) 5-carboxymethylaminomethyl modification radical SAM/GNAT enzyme Elp3, partial [Methanobacteriota archaeon]